jgi:hypothetical protein
LHGERHGERRVHKNSNNDLNVVSQLIGVTMKVSTIVKICKYIGFHEGHHFIFMVMKMHIAFGHDMDHFIKECAHLFSTIDDQKIIYSCFFAFNFSSNMLIFFFSML